MYKRQGFGGLFDSYSEPILQALDQLLSQQVFGPVRSLHDLDNLPRSESATLIRQWRSTLAQVAEPWSSLSFPQTRQILIRMLPGILKGDITTENFRPMAEQIQHRLIQETTSVELRFLTQVGQEKAETGQVQYRYLDARRGGHFFTKGSRPGRRVERFQQAEQILSELQEKNLDDRAIRLCHAQVQQHALVEPSTKDPIRVYWDRITKSECAHEMLLSGYEDVILSAPDMARALTHDERDAYEKKLRAMDRRIQAHRNELEQKLQTANLPAEQAQQLTDNFRQMIVRLDEQEQMCIRDRYKVVANGKEGYVSGEYLTGTTATDFSLGKAKIVCDTTVNFRSQPSTSSSVLASLKNGTVVDVTGVQSNWYKVTYNGKTGYVHPDYISFSGVQSTSSNSGSTATNNSGTSETIVPSTNVVSYTGTSEKRAEVLDYAAQFLGTPYVYGGSTPSGFDCSGSVSYTHLDVYKRQLLYRHPTARWGASFLSWREPQRKCGNPVVCSRKHGGSLSGFPKLHDNRRSDRTVCAGKNQF